MDFKIGNSKYQIGSKLFPVERKSKTKLFATENTEELNYPTLRKALNLEQYEEGRCYLNAEKVFMLGKLLKIPIEYYAGWVFVGSGQPPMHHAWNVLEGNVIDTSMNILDYDVLKGVDPKNPDWRKEVAPLLVENKKKPASQTAVFGQVWPWLLYVGCPSTGEHARKMFRDLRIDFPKHPSYSHRGFDMYGKSEIQKEMEKIK